MDETQTPAPDSPAQTPFFSATDREDGSLAIEFLTKEVGPASPDGKETNDRINILPGRYEELRALAGRFAGRTVVATGRGPIEGYFAIGYYAALAGAAGIVYEGANATPRVAMPDAGAAPADKRWLRVERRDGAVVATLETSPDTSGQWSDEEIGFTAPARLPDAAQSVVFTGSGAVRMYLLLGVSAARAGLADVRVFKPANPYAVRFSPDRAGETVSVASGKAGVVVGVIGDPNSGKSVFSRAFYMAVRESTPDWFQTWIYDCDLASPTPDWYCNALTRFGTESEEVKDYKDLRDSQKVKWNPDMEARCAGDLGILRTNLDLVIADLPGGRHPKEGETYFEPQRISGESRASMFRQCDAFVLLCRKDRHDEILKGWLDALARFGLQDRLVAVLDSSDPDAAFSISPLVPDSAGILCGDVRGLDRKHPAGETGRDLAGPVRPLVRDLAAIPVVNAARAATATAFLTGDKGTRYGAAVRSASTGRIFAAGQYSSFNHSTNVHAEMNALARAAAAGEPDVDLLAVASTSAGEASPCGVCRQVILEHALRTGRDFDVAFTTPGARPVFVPVSGLLPRAWSAHCNGSHAPALGAGAGDVRVFPGADAVFAESGPPRVGSEFVAPPVHPGAPDRMALVWDAAFARDAALVKFKYERTPDNRWRKLPHAFTESAAYLRYLVDNRRGSGTFAGLATLKLPVRNKRDGSPEVLFKHPVPLSGDMLGFLGDALFAPVGIDAASAVTVTCSRMTGLASADSDWDLCVAATAVQIDALRARVAALAAEGRVSFPDKSRSWKLLKDSFPGAVADGGARLHAERRYAESFRLDDIPISLLFVRPGSDGAGFAFPGPFAAVGRAAIAGRVSDASLAPYKRSESVVETFDRRRVRLLCYYKTANLLKDGDSIAATGVLCLHPDAPALGCAETLVLSAAAVDKLVWLP